MADGRSGPHGCGGSRNHLLAQVFSGVRQKEYGRELTFYVLMTILVGALGIAFIALSPPSDDFDDSSGFTLFVA
jgi:hypothetical protein